MTSKYDMILLGLALFAGTASAQVSQARPPYSDPTLPIERRVDDLLARMTLEEKVGQMLCLWQGKRAITDSAGRFDPSRVSDRSEERRVGKECRSRRATCQEKKKQ